MNHNYNYVVGGFGRIREVRITVISKMEHVWIGDTEKLSVVELPSGGIMVERRIEEKKFERSYFTGPHLKVEVEEGPELPCGKDQPNRCASGMTRKFRVRYGNPTEMKFKGGGKDGHLSEYLCEECGQYAWYLADSQDAIQFASAEDVLGPATEGDTLDQFEGYKVKVLEQIS